MLGFIYTKSNRTLAKKEEQLAWVLLFPTLAIIFSIVILPLASIFWISFKPISLSDLRPPKPIIKERLKGKLEIGGDKGEIHYRIRNSSRDQIINNVKLVDTIPRGLKVLNLDDRCQIDQRKLSCNLGSFKGGYREVLKLKVTSDEIFYINKILPKETIPKMTGKSENVLTNLNFSLVNFIKIFDRDEFFQVLFVTLFYTVFGTVGALLMGLLAALILNANFRGQGIFRGLFLFPYVAPVIAVAFTWVLLFDPFSGSINALLIQMQVIETPINFFGKRPLALIMVTVFEIWRYFPLSFLFILARMQSIDNEMYEAAEMDGASPFQKFWYLSIPMLLGILSILFLLRFIWTFNKFDDIFLLTGGNAGTRTLTVNVYEQAFALSNIGAGAAVAVVIFIFLLIFSILFFKFISREEGL